MTTPNCVQSDKYASYFYLGSIYISFLTESNTIIIYRISMCNMSNVIWLILLIKLPIWYMKNWRTYIHITVDKSFCINVQFILNFGLAYSFSFELDSYTFGHKWSTALN